MNHLSIAPETAKTACRLWPIGPWMSKVCAAFQTVGADAVEHGLTIVQTAAVLLLDVLVEGLEQGALQREQLATVEADHPAV